MSGRTFAVGDVHGDRAQLEVLLDRLPPLDADDTVVFLGDYVDRGPDSAGVVDLVAHGMAWRTAARIVALRGNHEDAWLRVLDEGWDDFVLPASNGCLATLRSFWGGAPARKGDAPEEDERGALLSGAFFPDDVVRWMRGLPFFWEDDHAIYVHAGLIRASGGAFLHPSKVEAPRPMLWLRTREFFAEYRGKRVVVGHTVTRLLPPELSTFTPEDPDDLWAGPAVVAIDTGCGKGGFLTAIELPSLTVYESR
ncbi:MAG: metallophosphoesterase [Acidobacteriota bacterium]